MKKMYGLPPLSDHHDPVEINCSCANCQMNFVIAMFLLTRIEPTDRALRPYGMPPASPQGDTK